MKPAPLARVPTLFLKTVLVLIAAAVLVLCFFLFPSVWTGIALEWPAIPKGWIYSGLIPIYLTLLPFLFALAQTFLLLRSIDKHEAFSLSSIRALRNIKVAAVTMTVLYWCGMPLVFLVAELDDAPGLILFGFAFTCLPLVIATFAAVLQKLVYSAVALKAENDLTV